MRSAAGFAFVHLTFALPGMALLYALGLVWRRAHLVTALGPAYICGLAIVMPVLLGLLVIDVPVRLPLFVAVASLLAGSFGLLGLLAGRRGRQTAEAPAQPPGTSFDQWVQRIAFAALVLWFVLGTTAFVNLPPENDEWVQWSYKGLALYEFGGRLQPEVFEGIEPSTAHHNYPIAQPLLQSIFFRAMGGIHLQESHAVLWIICGCFIWTVGFLMRSRGAEVLFLIPLAVLAITPSTQRIIASGLPDVTVGGFAAAGALSIALWLEGGRSRYAVLGALFLAAAANTKNEGLVAALAMLLVAGGVIAFGKLRRWRSWVGACAIVGVAVAPWIAWRIDRGLTQPADIHPLSESLDLSFLGDRTGRLDRATDAVFEQLANQGDWLWVVPCFLVVSIICFARRTGRREAIFYLATATLMVLSLLWVYWTGRLEISHHLMFSVDRVITGVVFVAGAGLIHLTAILSPLRARSSPV